jgi:hypothetical protein
MKDINMITKHKKLVLLITACALYVSFHDMLLPRSVVRTAQSATGGIVALLIVLAIGHYNVTYGIVAGLFFLFTVCMTGQTSLEHLDMDKQLMLKDAITANFDARDKPIKNKLSSDELYPGSNFTDKEKKNIHEKHSELNNVIQWVFGKGNKPVIQSSLKKTVPKHIHADVSKVLQHTHSDMAAKSIQSLTQLANELSQLQSQSNIPGLSLTLKQLQAIIDAKAAADAKAVADAKAAAYAKAAAQAQLLRLPPPPMPLPPAPPPPPLPLPNDPPPTPTPAYVPPPPINAYVPPPPTPTPAYVPPPPINAYVPPPPTPTTPYCRTRNDGTHGVYRYGNPAAMAPWNVESNTTDWDRECAKASPPVLRTDGVVDKYGRPTVLRGCGARPHHRCEWVTPVQGAAAAQAQAQQLAQQQAPRNPLAQQQAQQQAQQPATFANGYRCTSQEGYPWTVRCRDGWKTPRANACHGCAIIPQNKIECEKVVPSICKWKKTL